MSVEIPPYADPHASTVGVGYIEPCAAYTRFIVLIQSVENRSSRHIFPDYSDQDQYGFNSCFFAFLGP